MEFENFWGINNDSEDDLKYTSNVYKIMDEQCKYLLENTQGKIFAVFGEIKIDGSLIVIAKAMAETFKGISGITGGKESVDEASTVNLIDANSMYYNKRYAFEICTEKYKFRLFELRMTPIYPIEIVVDEGICKNIGSTLNRKAISTDKSNCFKLNDEQVFCDVLREILRDKKVHYIITKLKERVMDESGKAECLPDKVIICEGQTDEMIIQAIARRLNQKITTVIAYGKYNVPVVFDAVKSKNNKSNILILIDSDGDEEETKNLIKEKIGQTGYKLAIVNNCIEDWFGSEVSNFSKLKLMQSADIIVDKINFLELSQAHESFAKVVEFMRE